MHFDSIEFEATYVCLEGEAEIDSEEIANVAHDSDEAFELFLALIEDREEFQDQCRDALGETTLTVQKVIEWIQGEGPRPARTNRAKALVQALVQGLIEVGVISPLPEWLKIKLPKVSNES